MIAVSKLTIADIADARVKTAQKSHKLGWHCGRPRT